MQPDWLKQHFAAPTTAETRTRTEPEPSSGVNRRDFLYNGPKQSDVGGTYGLQKLGIHNVGVFFTRGILPDVLAYKGGDRLPPDYVITPTDIQRGGVGKGQRHGTMGSTQMIFPLPPGEGEQV
jgi:hypothetical protein